MSDLVRPDPDRLLARIADDERRAKKGKLKIFFGSVAGVGKTCAMLQAGHEKRAEGVDVVAGWIETHGRPGPQALLEGFEILPPQKVHYRGLSFDEFNLKLALLRHPQLMLVDELAHTNVEGSRYPKRWQDVEALLEAGIDVYTTVNVQHLESLNDAVGQIAGVRIRETLPDKIFDQADEVSLIDLPAKELLDRLREGKIYREEEARRAAKHFFKEGNLIALREMALRETTQRVDAQMQVYRERHAISESSSIIERVLVCIGPNPQGERLIREGKRFASELCAQWIVVYVETPTLERLEADERDRILRSLRLAEELGAKTATLTGSQISEEIIRYAREHSINKIMMGRPTHRGLRRWMQGSVVDRVIAGAQSINVYLLGSCDTQKKGNDLADGRGYGDPTSLGLNRVYRELNFVQARSYFWALMTPVVATYLIFEMRSFLSIVNIAMIFLLGIFWVSLVLGRGPTLLASSLSVAAFDFFFIEPYLAFTVPEPQYALTFLVMIGGGLAVSYCLDALRHRVKVSGDRERRSMLLFNLMRDLNSCVSKKEALELAVNRIHLAIGGPVAILLPNNQGLLECPWEMPKEHSLGGADLAVAQWVFDHNELAGKGSERLSAATAVYIPMPGEGGPGGVLVVDPPSLRQVFLPEERKLLDVMSGLVVQWVSRNPNGRNPPH